MHNDITDRDTPQADSAPYAAHLLKLAAIEAAEDDVRREAHARAAALGPMEGPCCSPAESAPCLACDPLDVSPDEPYEPTEEELADYRAWSRERDERLFAERLAADDDRAYRDQMRAEADARLAAAVFAAAQAGTFQQMLDGFANALTDHERDDVRWLGLRIGQLCDRARYLEATSGEQYSDREDAMLDSILAAHATR